MKTGENTTARRPRTKILCTLGPSTRSEKTIQALIEAGMSVARLNFSHGTVESHAAAVQRVRDASARVGLPVGIMVDVPGSKFRTGPIASGSVELRRGDRVTLTSEDVPGTQETISVSPPGIHLRATVKAPIFIDDGIVELRATEIERNDVRCEVVVGGTVTESRGVAVAGTTTPQHFNDERAKAALRFAVEHDAEFVALSMVAGPNDVEKARNTLIRLGLDIPIVSKIETSGALDNFRDILSASDSIIVARGDMGVAVPLAKVPVIQKDLISKSNAAGKPVVIATQMLESMVRSEVPTRAEVADIANAVFDGADAVMLSGETAIGQYPVEAVKVMAEVAREAEAALPYETMLREKARQLEPQTHDAIAYDACRTAYQLRASLIVAFTESGISAGHVSKYRPLAPILALTPDERVQRRLTLRWGVTPVIVDNVRTLEELFTKGEEHARRNAAVEPGSLVVLVAGLPIGVIGTTNLLRVLEIQ